MKKKIILDYIRSYDEEPFKKLKGKCSRRGYSTFETKPPKKYTKAGTRRTKRRLNIHAI